MGRRGRRRRRSLTRALPAVAAPPSASDGQAGHLVALALEARLLGLRLLTVRAVVDVAEPSRVPPSDTGRVLLEPEVVGRRRDAEALLVAAQRTLGASRSSW